MIDFKNITHFYFIGIGGIGMSARVYLAFMASCRSRFNAGGPI